ncbi:MAG: hypothetical protein GY917_21285 [Planctomycetaceae bacterium]|nr:hypothetical protein [Planctomycetaceae bacterium]
MTDQLGDFRLPETRQQRLRRYLVVALVMSVGLILLPGQVHSPCGVTRGTGALITGAAMAVD